MSLPDLTPDAAGVTASRWGRHGGVVATVACTLLAIVGLGLVHEEGGEAALRAMAQQQTVVGVIPFALLLLTIAVAPLVLPHLWEHNWIKGVVAAGLAAPVALYLASFGEVGLGQLVEKSREYVSFVVLLGALYVISGGIFVRGSLSGTPLANTALLGIGAVLASLVGTTGASMVLIRPLLRANQKRQQRAHIVVFFIFVVSNCGGILTPLGDPPLFLGFLKGVPFEWPVTHLWLPWVLINAALLVIFQTIDQLVFAREEKQRPGSQLEEVLEHEPLRVEGLGNLALLLGIVAVVVAAGRGLGASGGAWPFGVQEGLMLLLAAVSWFATPLRIHHANKFGFAPIVEVAVLFAGIFVTMAPALLLLNAKGAALGLNQPWHFFWASGLLSSFLDNAPTYLTFAATAAGMQGIATEGRYLAQLVADPVGQKLLIAVSSGAVLMGANTYIGNGPNFMVKAIAEQNGVKMPSFFGYMAWSGCVLLPLFLVLTLVMFRG